MINNLIMKLEDLKVLIAVAENKNFRQAAESLGLSQAAVTYKLAALAGTYTSPLLMNEGKKKILTPFGEALVKTAKKQFHSFELAVNEVERLFTDDISTALRVGCRPEVFSYLAPKLPTKHNYQLIPLPGPAVAPAILAGEIDFGFTHTFPDSPNILAKKAFRSHIRLVCHKKYLPPKSTPADLWKNRDFLAQTPTISYGKEGHLLNRVCGARDLKLTDLNIKFTADSWSVLADLVNAGLGYAIIPDYIPVNPTMIDITIPSSVSENLDFYFLMRSAYRDIELYRQLRKISWS